MQCACEVLDPYPMKVASKSTTGWEWLVIYFWSYIQTSFLSAAGGGGWVESGWKQNIGTEKRLPVELVNIQQQHAWPWQPLYKQRHFPNRQTDKHKTDKQTNRQTDKQTQLINIQQNRHKPWHDRDCWSIWIWCLVKVNLRCFHSYFSHQGLTCW